MIRVRKKYEFEEAFINIKLSFLKFLKSSLDFQKHVKNITDSFDFEKKWNKWMCKLIEMWNV